MDGAVTDILACQGQGGMASRLGHKLGDSDDTSPAPPALPPRPPPRPRNPIDPALSIDHHHHLHLKRTRVKKYVFLCSVCGGLASLLGTLFLAVYLILRTYTSSLDYFETIPTYIPAAMLMVTGLAVMCLARRRNRYIFLIKLCGLCCLMCVGTCVLVTVTTTVVHMSRLQSLRECVYTLKTQTCTCYSVLLESASERTDESSRYVFNATPDCEAIHGALYSCLRALFGLSVIGILVCIFCCMLVYQLLSHERKKMYWEQLELRCRYLYGQASNPVRSNALAPGGSGQPTQHCACCQQFRFQQDILTWEPTDNRFWGGGQVGNLYSPNPVGDDCMPPPLPEPSTSGWSWRRLPWSRQAPTIPAASANSRNSSGYHQPLNCSSPDSQYGFSSDPGRVATVSSSTASYTVIDPVMQGGAAAGCHVYHWGPPPPYSDPNSPSRQVMCPPGPHHHHCQQQQSQQLRNPNNTDNDSESCRVLQLRIPSRRPDLPLTSSSSSSIKSSHMQTPNDADCGRHQRTCARPELKPIQRLEDGEWNDCNVSPRIRYLHNKLQNSSVNSIRKRTQEPSESEVYFGDVSSCNVSVRNDSISIYNEALDNKRGERAHPMLNELQENRIDGSFQKQLRITPSRDDKALCHQGTCNPKESPPMQCKSDSSSKEVLTIQRVPLKDKFSYTGKITDGSEEDELELVNLNQRQPSVKGRLPHYRNEISINPQGEHKADVSEPIQTNLNEFPSPMSISSPSTVSKGTCGFYAEVGNSEHGSTDSVWSGYSADLLAPDAQYEVIPEHRRTSPEDLNGNPNENGENQTRVKPYQPTKKRPYSQNISENWTHNNSVSDKRDATDRYKWVTHNINSQKSSDRVRESQKPLRSNEKCLASILNSPKSNFKNTRSEQPSKINHGGNYSDRRCGDFPSLSEHNNSPESDFGGLYYTINENDNIFCDRNSHDLGTSERTRSSSPKEMTEQELTSVTKVSDKPKLSTNYVNPLDTNVSRECFHSDSNCRCFSSTNLSHSELGQVRPVDV